LPTPLELADVEGVEADQLAGPRGVHVPSPSATGTAELPSSPLGEQPTGPGAVVLEQSQASPSARQASVTLFSS